MLSVFCLLVSCVLEDGRTTKTKTRTKKNVTKKRGFCGVFVVCPHFKEDCWFCMRLSCFVVLSFVDGLVAPPLSLRNGWIRRVDWGLGWFAKTTIRSKV